MEQTMTVATFNDPVPAELLKDRFIAAGLHAELVDESGVQALLFMSPRPRAHMRVRVRKEEYESGKRLTAEWESQGVMQEAVRCPQCGGSRVEYPQWSRRTLESLFFGFLSLIHLVPREYFCEDCQFTWPDKVAPTVQRDALNWPRESKVP